MSTGIRISSSLENDICKKYQEYPISLNEMSKIFGLCTLTISRILKKYDIKLYSKQDFFEKQLKSDYFEKIDCDKKAYFLGLLITDGCIYTKGTHSRLCLALQYGDKYIVEELKSELKSNRKLTMDKRNNKAVSLQVSSDKICKDLAKYSIIPNKSLATVFPKNIPSEYLGAFYRGLLDGDGSISFYKRKGKINAMQIAIRMCQGNKKFLEDFVEILHDILKTSKPTIFQEKEQLWSIAYRRKEDLKKIIEFLYSGDEIAMIRKKQKCFQIFNYINSNLGVDKCVI